MSQLKEEISQLIQSFNNSLKKNIPALGFEVEKLIEEKSTDKNKIEYTLDVLISLTMHGVADDLFIKLLDYYKTLDADGAQFYWNEYDKDEE